MIIFSTTPCFKFFLLLLLVVISRCQYQPNWDSLDSRPVPEWYLDAKFGIFIHWGVYSVPSWAPVGEYAEWYWTRVMAGSGPTYDFHVKTYGKDFTYQEFGPMFHAEIWNPDEWAQLFSQAGARYVVPTSKHHEGFTLWPSAVSWNWNAKDVGPRRDLLGDLFTSLRSYDLRACAYFSLYEWYNPLYIGSNPEEYVAQIMLPQLYDLVQTYQPDIIWGDGAWDHPSEFWNSTEFLAWLYNEAPNKDEVVVNDRWGSETPGFNGGFFTAEYSDQYWLDHKWEANCGIDVHSYGLNRMSLAQNYSSSEYLIELLIRTVAYGGNLLLDIGPASDGSIPVVMQERLLDIGQWLDVNGESIYDTRIWNYQNESSMVFYTQNANLSSVYAIFINWPSSNVLSLEYPTTSSDTEITLLGYGAVNFKPNSQQGVVISLPSLSVEELPSQYAWALKMTNLSNMKSKW